jgi:hypothetical protein
MSRHFSLDIRGHFTYISYPIKGILSFFGDVKSVVFSASVCHRVLTKGVQIDLSFVIRKMNDLVCFFEKKQTLFCLILRPCRAFHIFSEPSFA